MAYKKFLLLLIVPDLIKFILIFFVRCYRSNLIEFFFVWKEKFLITNELTFLLRDFEKYNFFWSFVNERGGFLRQNDFLLNWKTFFLCSQWCNLNLFDNDYDGEVIFNSIHCYCYFYLQWTRCWPFENWT